MDRNDHEHEFGPVETARFTGNPHRACACGFVTLDVAEYCLVDGRTFPLECGHEPCETMFSAVDDGATETATMVYDANRGAMVDLRDLTTPELQGWHRAADHAGDAETARMVAALLAERHA